MSRPSPLLATALAAVAVVAVGASTAVAGSKIAPKLKSCSALNCKSEKIRGSVEANADGNADPFVVQVFSAGGECLRIDVTNSPSIDLEAVLVAPDGTVWRNDDKDIFNLLPRIEASTPDRGWYTLILSHYFGLAVNGDFAAQIGRYPLGNANCLELTPPLSPPASLVDQAVKEEPAQPQDAAYLRDANE